MRKRVWLEKIPRHDSLALHRDKGDCSITSPLELWRQTNLQNIIPSKIA